TARSLNPRLTIISRASSDSAERKLRMGGVDHIVMPEKVGGMHMARLVARSNIIEFLEHLSIKGSDPSIIEEVSCVSLDKNHQNKSLNELELRKKTGVNIIGLKKPSGEYIINPSPDVKINAKSNLYVLGTYEQLEKMRKMLSH
ncbi:MAG: potassium channel family protein, partial [Bacteroidota bacterium]